MASTGGAKTEETPRAITKGAAANATYVAAVLMTKPLADLLLVICLLVVEGSLPDTFKITAVLVNPSASLWWETGQVLVKIW